MSSRALRKAQREREEQDNLQKLKDEAAALEDDEEEESVTVQPPKTSAFALLEQANDVGDEEDQDVVDDEADAEYNAAIQPSIAPLTTSSTKKKRKKKKTKGSTTPSHNEEQLDDIDRALKQLSTNANADQSGTTSAGVSAIVDETSSLLAIDVHHLHAQNEMRRLFGRAALEHQDDDDQVPQNEHVGGNRRQQRRVQQVGLAQALRGQGGQNGRASGLAALALKKNIFIQGKEEWPAAPSGGLGMEIAERRADGTILYRFVHNRIYQDVQRQFDIAVESMDPQRLVVLLQHNPYHISTLLQVSEIAKQERDHTTSGDLLERALFSFGRAVHSTFAKTLAEGKARLDFNRPENRELWLASWRYMQNLSMRATWRTVYEWAKLLLSLSPEDDPYAMWLVLDQYALRARQDLDFLNLSRNSLFSDIVQRMPSVQISQGLAEYRAGNKSKGQQALFKSLGRYPWVTARLMQELSLDPPPAIWGQEARSATEKLFAEVYATRAKDIWNIPENSALLLEIASAIPKGTPVADIDSSAVSRNVARHVILSDVPALIALAPRSYTSQLDSTSDPLPPSDGFDETGYMRPETRDTRDDTPAQTLNELQQLHTFFSASFPWFNAFQVGEGQAPQPPDDAELARQMTDAGLSREDFTRLMTRFRELATRIGQFSQADLVGVFGNGNGEAPEAGDADATDLPLQARVEDAEDEGA